MFTERRELGILNIGCPGNAVADGEIFDMENSDALCIGRGTQHIRFESRVKDHPAGSYLLSFSAHAEYPTRLVRSAGAGLVDSRWSRHNELRVLLSMGDENLDYRDIDELAIAELHLPLKRYRASPAPRAPSSAIDQEDVNLSD